MAMQETGLKALDYAPCRYGDSRTLFRGPAKSLTDPYVAVIGGTETYGRFVAKPYPDLVEDLVGTTTVNFGCVNAGLDVFINDPVILRACADSALTVVQVVGAQNMSNRFYKVHPRRNDRFLRASRQMLEIWPDVDFTEIHFTRHLLSALRASSADRFEMLRRELSEAWVARMRSLVRECGGRVVLLWMADRRPEDSADMTADTGPLFVDREMIETLRRDVLDVIEVVAPQPYASTDPEGMIFPPLERSVAMNLPGPAMHSQVASDLGQRLRQFL